MQSIPHPRQRRGKEQGGCPGAVLEITCISLEVFGGDHDHKANGTLVSEHLVGPPADGAHALDGGDAVVGDENLQGTETGV